MSLYKRISLSINDYTGVIVPNIKFYVNDCLDLVFNIKSWDVRNKLSTDATDSTLTLENMTANLLVESPNETDTIEATQLVGNDIKFRLEKKFTKIPGVGRMQLMLIDSDGCEVKTPEFSFEIRRTINESLDDIPVTYQAHTTEDGKILLTEDGKIIVN